MLITERPLSMKYLVCCDSDGCVFDSMEKKHNSCFIPQTVRFWSPPGFEKELSEVARYISLYSPSRGKNRFPALLEMLNSFYGRNDVIKAGIGKPGLDSLEKWLSVEKRPSNSALQKYLSVIGKDEILHRTLLWSDEINRAVAGLSEPPKPFANAFSGLERLSKSCDILVVSTTPEKTLADDWQRENLARYIGGYFGQESGKKTESVAKCLAVGEYSGRALMIGDSPVDREAASANGILFFPIIPGSEEKSWIELAENGCNRFFGGSFKGQYEEQLLACYDKVLGTIPDWLKC